MINPHRITIALDRAKLFGPTADAKVDAHEPDLDNWEAGRSEPTEAQLTKLARLANVTRAFFELPDSSDPRISVALVRGRRGCFQQLYLLGTPEPYQPTLDGAE